MRKTKESLNPTVHLSQYTSIVPEIAKAFRALDLDTDVVAQGGKPTQLITDLIESYEYRADALNNYVEPRLMDAERAKREFDKLYQQLKPNYPILMNKQKDEKKAPEFLTGIINMIVEANNGGTDCDYDPRELTTVTMNGAPFAHWQEGLMVPIPVPSIRWLSGKSKEYYYTTTFGSRVAG